MHSNTQFLLLSYIYDISDGWAGQSSQDIAQDPLRDNLRPGSYSRSATQRRTLSPLDHHGFGTLLARL